MCVRHTSPRDTSAIDICDTDPGVESTVHVVVKYVRSILPLLQRATSLTVILHADMGLLIEYGLNQASGFILLKDRVRV
jgi:hypothetical protein